MKKRVLMIASALVLCVNVFFAIGQSSGANIEVLISGVPFIPGTKSHLVVRGTNLFWTESSVVASICSESYTEKPSVPPFQ